MIATQTNLLIREPAASYHARSRELLTSHGLQDFRKCPLLYRRKQLGQIPEGHLDAFLVGSAAHTLILEGAAIFRATYAVGGPINPKTGRPFGPTTKAFARWAARAGKPVLTDEQHQLVVRLAQSVRVHKVAGDLLASRTGTAEGVVRTSYYGVPSQIRMDWFDPHVGIVDLKTCDDLTWFEADARRFEYVHQLAFYRAVLAQEVHCLVPVHIIAVEKRQPHRTGVWRVDDLPLAQAQAHNEAAIERLRECMATNHWPTGYETPRALECL